MHLFQSKFCRLCIFSGAVYFTFQQSLQVVAVMVRGKFLKLCG